MIMTWDCSFRIQFYLFWALCLHSTAKAWVVTPCLRNVRRNPTTTTRVTGSTWPRAFCRSYADAQLQLSSSNTPQNEPSASLLDAFAGLTQSTCQLLGVKSIGVDYGLVRTGVARTAGYQPQPVEILTDYNATQLANHVVRLAKHEGASKIILGLPLHKNGTVAEQTNLTLVFGQVLAQAALQSLGPAATVELWDERYTSKEAAARAHSRNPHQTLYGMLDAEAACIILEQYYNDNGKDAEIIEIHDENVRQDCLAAYLQRQEIERNQKQAHLEERERLLQRRKEAILRDQKAAAVEAASAGGKKKKKKKKRR